MEEEARKAAAAFQQGKWREAVASYKWLWTRDGQDPVWWLQGGLALLQLRRYREAALASFTASSLNPPTTLPHLCAARALVALGRTTEAQEELDKVLHPRAPSSSWQALTTLDLMASARQVMGTCGKLESYLGRGQALLKSAGVAPGLAQSWEVKAEEGSMDQRLKEWEASGDVALDLADRAQILAPASVTPLILKVQALLIARRYSQALAICQSALLAPSTLPGLESAASIAQGPTETRGKVAAAPELWLLHARALHLSSNFDFSERLLRAALECHLMNAESLSDSIVLSSLPHAVPH